MNKDFLWIAFFVIMGIFLGFIISQAYDEVSKKRMINGLYFENKMNYSQVIEKAKATERSGNWVCVNINGMDYKTAVQTCNHEVGHEIFALYCQKHIDECINITEVK